MGWQKKVPRNQVDKNPDSTKRRQINELIQKCSYPEALSLLDEWVASEDDSSIVARCLVLVGESQLKRGLHKEAAEVFQKAFALVEKSWSDWLTPAFGEFRSWLVAQDAEKAQNKAEFIFHYAESREKDYEIYLLQASQQLQQKGELLIDSQPPDAGEIANRLAGQFLRYGYRDAARFYYQQALSRQPIKAKLGLAQLALDENDFKTAIDLASEALQEGNFSSETLSGWEILIGASVRSNKKTDWFSWFEKLGKAAVNSVKARATVIMVRALRNYQQSQWINIVETYLKGSNDVAATAELRKLLLNHSKQNSSWQQQKVSALALLATPKLAPQEWVFGTKSLLRASAYLNQPLAMDRLQQQAQSLFPKKYLPALYHGFALACIEAEKIEWGEPWLELNLNNLPVSNRYWQKAAWRLAEISVKKENFSRAIELWMRLALTQEIALRDRLFAFIGWGKAAAKMRMLDTIPDIAAQFRVVVSPVQDYELLLDLARQLIYAPEALNQLVPELLNKGLTLGLKTFHKSKLPEAASRALWRITRAQSEAGENEAIIQFWETLSSQKKEWLWNLSASYWDYIAYVVRAYGRTKKLQQATALAQTLLLQPETPQSARAQLTLLWGLMELKQDKIKIAFHRLAEGVELAPQHPLAAHAYYWFALRAYAQNNKSDHIKNIDLLSRNLGFDVLKNKPLRKLWLKTQWIRCDLQEDKFPQSHQGETFSNHEKTWTLEEVKKDLAKLRT
ncbi:MAG: hypothetical protein R3F23_02795 [Verrucomicrobiia bacterium]